MKLLSLKMENFRQFYGKHEIYFSSDTDKNVTVIHGENGSGKTTILNAFKWCFYGNTDFDTGNDNILNEQAVAVSKFDEDIPIKISVEFEHEGINYSIDRVQDYYKSKNNDSPCIGGSIVDLWINDGSGETRKSENPETHLKQILPENMHPYFFFNGERIEKLSAASQSSKIQKAIKSLMGLEIVERASNHLSKGVKRHFNKKMKSDASSDLRDIYDKENELEDEKESLNEKLQLYIDNQESYKEQKIQVEEDLSKIEESSKLQKERESLEEQLKSLYKDKEELSLKRKKLISKEGFLVFAKDVFRKCDEILEVNRAKGELPYKVKEQFIDDLLESNMCICGRPLNHGTDEYDAIASYRKKAGNIELENEFMLTSSAAKQQPNALERFNNNFIDLQTDIDKCDKDITTCNGRLDELGEKIKGVDHDQIPDLEKRREDLTELIKNESNKEFHCKREIAKCEQEKDDLSKRRIELEKESQQHLEVTKQRDAVITLQKTIDELYNSLSNQVRVELSKKVNDTFKEIIRKSYSAEIDENYTLQIYKEGFNNERQKVYEKSTGENQITSLSFISSIINQAKERYQQEKTSSFYKGGLFPLVMDSPFGALDDDYRTKIAHHIPKLAEQVIIMVSNSQWRGVVEEQCSPKVGKQWNLIYHSPSITPEKETHYVKSSSEYEYTDISEV